MAGTINFNELSVDPAAATVGYLNLYAKTDNLLYTINSSGTVIPVGAAVAYNIAGGTTNQIAFQTGVNTTSFLTAPTVAGTGLQWNGSAFVWGAAAGPVSGTATLGMGMGMSSGQVTVSCTAVTALSIIIISYGSPNGAPWSSGFLYSDPADIVPGTSFIINEIGGSGMFNVNWVVLN